MHDPLAQAFHVCLPIPFRRWSLKNQPRFGLRRMRRTNQKNLGQPVYPWWRPAGVQCFAFGSRWGLYQLATVWHVEPRGADSGSICNRRMRAWHVHHWRVQVHPWQTLRRFLFERCGHCGERFPWGYSPISHQWDPKRRSWWRFWDKGGHAYHASCSELIGRKRDADLDRTIIRTLMAEVRVRADESETEALERVRKGMEFPISYRFVRVMGYEFHPTSHVLQKRRRSFPAEEIPA